MIKKTLALMLASMLIFSSVFIASATEETVANDSAANTTESEAVEAEKDSPSAEAEATASEPVEEKTDSAAASAEIMPSAAQLREAAPAPNYNGKVTFVGQWVGESSSKKDTERNFTSASDKLGAPEANGGLLRGLAKTFLAWSDQPAVDNGHLAPGARYFSPEDTIATAFPNGIPADAKLYGVYFSLLENDAPFKSNFDFLSLGSIASKFKNIINNNKASIDESLSAEDIRPNTENDSETYDGKIRTMLDYYKKNADNEVLLSAEFQMDPAVALVVYRNPVGSNALRPILSRDYNTRKADGEFSTVDGRSAGYTYVDLNVDLDEGLSIPEKLYLEFSGYSWRPLYAMDGNKNLLEVLDPSNDASLGNDKNSFNSLVNDKNPNVVFGVKTNGASKITIRVIVREPGVDQIKETNIVAGAGKTVTETILSNMTLKALSKAELGKLRPELKDDELKSRIIRVSDEKAAELAKTNGEKTLSVGGNVKGHMFADAGSVTYMFTLQLKSDTAIKEVAANVLKLGYLGNNVAYTFVSGTDGKDLPEDVISKQPEDMANALDGDKVTLPTYDEIKVADGIWTFDSWYTPDNSNPANAVSGELAVEAGKDMSLVGVWKFKAHYDVNFDFISDTKDKELPDEVKALKPENKTFEPDGKIIDLKSFDDVKVDGGVWKFVSWYTVDKNGERVAVKDSVAISGASLDLTGTWVFEADKKAEEKPEAKSDSKKDGGNTKIEKKTVNTGDDNTFALPFIIMITSAAGILLLAMTKKHFAK
ncbi:MAG: SHIRT domain-containing protein [Eubacterium sp.]|nr:SHIRT domain-containing protein [Eubacterium sp.]